MIDWIVENKEWIFSGIGIVVLSFIGALIKLLISKRSNKKERTVNMYGDKSTYIEKNDGEVNIK